MKINAVNQLGSEEILYHEGDRIDCVYMVMKGKVEIYNKGVLTVVGAGTLLGVNGLEGGTYICNCKTVGSTSVFAFENKGNDILSRILGSNKDYNGMNIFNHARIVSDMNRQYRKLFDCAGELFTCLKKYYAIYIDIIKNTECRAVLMPEIVQLERFQPEYILDEEKLKYYIELGKIPFEMIKGFYSSSNYITLANLSHIFLLEETLLDACAEVADYVVDTFMLLAGDENYSLYKNMLGLGIDLRTVKKTDSRIDESIDGCRVKVEEVKELICRHTGRTWDVDETSINYMNECYVSGHDFREKETGEDNAVTGSTAIDLNTLTDSMTQIMNYGEYPKEKSESFKRLIDEFMGIPDKNSIDDNLRILRKDISNLFYELYSMVFCATYYKPDVPKAVELFLDYGYISEKLLRDDQLIDLIELKRDSADDPCCVYTLRQWLNLIYEGKKEPSRNEMGQDFSEVLRDLKRQGKIDEGREKELMKDGAMKLDYEIKNVFKYGNRIVNGQLTIFVPILYEDLCIGSLKKAFLSGEKINNTVRRLLDIDFSAFHREVLYVDNEKGIEREYQMKQVMPAMIVYPIIGQNCCLWQEITGRYRDSEGRILLPSFTYNNLNDMLIKAFGHFRWAMCKTLQGPNWNNIQYKSMTSEYSDYIQFYKKNRELSEERREKIKLQIQKGRNNLREIFTSDYEAWMKSESNGAIKMNKVVREIFAMYCPFNVDIRTLLMKQPIYEEAYARSCRERLKKSHEIELRFRALERKDITVPEELIETLKFYKEL